MNQQQLQISPDMVKNAKQVECDECGNITFKEVLTFKKMSAILSPTGQEEVVPMPIVVCEKCGKVSAIFNPHKVVPKELLAKKNKPEPKMEVVKNS